MTLGKGPIAINDERVFASRVHATAQHSVMGYRGANERRMATGYGMVGIDDTQGFIGLYFHIL